MDKYQIAKNNTCEVVEGFLIDTTNAALIATNDTMLGDKVTFLADKVLMEEQIAIALVDPVGIAEDETGVDLYAPQNKKLRIQFIDFIEKVAPKEDGEISELPDIGETFKAFVATKRSSGQTQKSKDLASHSMERSDGTATEAPTPGRLTWDNVGDKIRDRLGM